MDLERCLDSYAKLGDICQKLQEEVEDLTRQNGLLRGQVAVLNTHVAVLEARPESESPGADVGPPVVFVPEGAAAFQLIDGRWELLYEPKSPPEGK